MSNIVVRGAKENGDGVIEMQVAADGSVSVPVSDDTRDVAPAPAAGAPQLLFGLVDIDDDGFESTWPCWPRSTYRLASVTGNDIGGILPAGTVKNVRICYSAADAITGGSFELQLMQDDTSVVSLGVVAIPAANANNIHSFAPADEFAIPAGGRLVIRAGLNAGGAATKINLTADFTPAS